MCHFDTNFASDFLTVSNLPKNGFEYLSRRHGGHKGHGVEIRKSRVFLSIFKEFQDFPRDLRVLRASVRKFGENFTTWHGFC
jgi:hypothetical protein